jgi:hypothetical protein
MYMPHATPLEVSPYAPPKKTFSPYKTHQKTAYIITSLITLKILNNIINQSPGEQQHIKIYSSGDNQKQ